MKFILSRIGMLASLLVLLSLNSYATSINVKVGAGVRPPFLINKTQGMGPEIISALNLVQNKFNFELVLVPISRRKQSLEESWIDIIMWDNINWGWDKSNLTSSKPLLASKDIFITHSAKTKNQSYFNSFENKRICGVNGYHYKFMHFQTDYAYLKTLFDIVLVRTEEESIKMALLDRCDISVVSESALNWFLKLNPEHKNDIMSSERFDTQYTRHFLVPQYAPISVTEIDDILDKLKQLGLLAPIYQKYGQKLM